MVGLERNQQADDEEDRLTTTVRMLKIRKRGFGKNTGKVAKTMYDPETGRLKKPGSVFDDTADNSGF